MLLRSVAQANKFVCTDTCAHIQHSHTRVAICGGVELRKQNFVALHFVCTPLARIFRYNIKPRADIKSRAVGGSNEGNAKGKSLCKPLNNNKSAM